MDVRDAAVGRIAHSDHNRPQPQKHTSRRSFVRRLATVTPGRGDGGVIMMLFDASTATSRPRPKEFENVPVPPPTFALLDLDPAPYLRARSQQSSRSEHCTVRHSVISSKENTYALGRTRKRVLVSDLLGLGLVRLPLQQIGDRSLGTVTVDRLQRAVALAAQRPCHVAEVTAFGQHLDGLAQLSGQQTTKQHR